MDKIEELHLIVKLLEKHHLPISPILEYEIKQKEDLYTTELGQYQYVHDEEANEEVSKNFDYYCNRFSNLSVGIVNGKKLPHKAIVLLAVMRLIDSSVLSNNNIELNKTIAFEFADSWKAYMGNVKVPSVWTPFWYLKSEPFWHFKASADESVLNNLLSFAGHPSIGQMRKVIKCAYLDEQLFSLMQDRSNRLELSTILIKTYIK